MGFGLPSPTTFENAPLKKKAHAGGDRTGCWPGGGSWLGHTGVGVRAFSLGNGSPFE
jgi:hypothetical protein